MRGGCIQERTKATAIVSFPFPRAGNVWEVRMDLAGGGEVGARRYIEMWSSSHAATVEFPFPLGAHRLMRSRSRPRHVLI